MLTACAQGSRVRELGVLDDGTTTDTKANQPEGPGGSAAVVPPARSDDSPEGQGGNPGLPAGLSENAGGTGEGAGASVGAETGNGANIGNGADSGSAGAANGGDVNVGGSLPPVPDACDAPTTSVSGGQCVDMSQSYFECNPVTNAGCDIAAGEACDLSSGGVWSCFPAPNDALQCEACDNAAGPFCQPGFTCDNGECTRYCCSDGDCGTGDCSKQHFAPGEPVGICKFSWETCEAPPIWKANGSCVDNGGYFGALAGLVDCDPVTNTGCDSAAGEACDVAVDFFGGIGFTCYPPPNDVAICSSCDASLGEFCGPGLTCDNGTCRRYCCADSDCGSGSCTLNALDSSEPLGLCTW